MKKGTVPLRHEIDNQWFECPIVRCDEIENSSESIPTTSEKNIYILTDIIAVYFVGILKIFLISSNYLLHMLQLFSILKLETLFKL